MGRGGRLQPGTGVEREQGPGRGHREHRFKRQRKRSPEGSGEGKGTFREKEEGQDSGVGAEGETGAKLDRTSLRWGWTTYPLIITSKVLVLL